MIYTVTLNPAIDKTVYVPKFTLDVVNRVANLRQDAGGKGINVSKVIKELGGTSCAFMILAGGAGKWLERALADMGIETEILWVEGESRTNTKIVDEELKTNTDVNEPGPKITDASVAKLLAQIKARVQKGDIVVLSGSLPQGVARDTYGIWVHELNPAGAKVFLDADGDALAAGLEAHPYFTKPNEIELGAMLNQKLTTREEVAKAAHVLTDRVNKVCISMGGEGAVFVDKNECLLADPVRVKVASTVGAGDSVVAAFAYAEEQGLALEEALRLAMATGAANVMQSGTQAAPYDTIEPLLSSVSIHKR